MILFFYRSTSASSNSTTVSNGSTSTSETLHIKSQRDSNRRLEMTEVQFSSELFMAPEMMYCSLELPSMVEECTKELPDHILKECFSNILITGICMQKKTSFQSNHFYKCSGSVTRLKWTIF